VKQFRFRLAQVMRVRRIQEDREKAALMVANRAAHLAAVRVEENLTEYAARPRPVGPQSMADFERTLFMLDAAAGAVTMARFAHRDAIMVVDEQRAIWTAAHRKVSALERLEERRRAEHEIEMRRAEDRLVDDLVVARHARGDKA
jgi:flagellar export protein FliJ